MMNREAEEKILRLYSGFEPLHLLSTLSVTHNQKASNILTEHIVVAQVLLLKSQQKSDIKSPPPKVYEDFQKSVIALDVETFVLPNISSRNAFFELKNENEEAFSALEKALEKSYAFSLTTALEFFDLLLQKKQEREEKRQAVITKLSTMSGIKKLQTSYLKLIADDKESVTYLQQIFKAKKYSRKEVLALVCTHYDLNIADIYTFKVDEFVADGLEVKYVRQMIEMLSFPFATLAQGSTEDLAHQVLEKPIIVLDDRHFFCALPELFFGFLLQKYAGLAHL
jgi:hypothetical protein